MKDFFKFKIIIFLFFSVAILACKSSRISSPNKKISDPLLGNEQNINDQYQDYKKKIESLKPRKEVSGEDLEIETLKIKLDPEDPNNSLIIEVDGDKEADFIQFALCPEGSKINCKPSFSKPYSFASKSHTYPDPFPGKNDLYVRSCVSKKRALNYLKPCGKWKMKTHIQANNFNPDLRKKLVAEYENSIKVLAKCQEIEETLDDYRSQNKDSSTNFDTLVDNFRENVPPETCKEILLSEDWEAIETSVRKEAKKQTAGKNEGASILLTIGTPTIIVGLGAAGIGLFIEAKNKNSVTTTDTIEAPNDRKLKFNKNNFTKGLITSGLIVAAVGAVLTIVESFGLDHATIDAQEKTKVKLDELFLEISALRNW